MKKISTERSHRQLKIAEEVRKIIVDGMLRDSYLSNFLDKISIVITKVDISPDLKNAAVYFILSEFSNSFSIVDQPKKQIISQDVLEINAQNTLNKCDFRFRTLLAKKLTIRYAPLVKFKVDKSLDYANKIEKIIKDINKK